MSGSMPKTQSEIDAWFINALTVTKRFLSNELFEEGYVQNIIRMEDSEFYACYTACFKTLSAIVTRVGEEDAILTALLKSRPKTGGFIELHDNITVILENMKEIAGRLIEENKTRNYI